MKYCSQCGSELTEGAKFCSECGAPAGSGSTATAGKTVKCPQCGELIDAFVAKCPACGYELRGAPAASSLCELMDRLQTYEKGGAHKKGFISHLWRVTSEAEDAAASLIREFPIPNTKEDLMEFLVLAASNVDPDAFNELKKASLSPAEAMRSRAWMAKLEQAYQKASITMGNDSGFARCEEIYNKTSRKVLHARRALVYFLIGLALAWIVLIIVAVVLAPK